MACPHNMLAKIRGGKSQQSAYPPTLHIQWKSVCCQPEYLNCDYKTKSSTDLEHHDIIKHKIDDEFAYPSSSEIITCGECGKEFFLDHTYVLHVYSAQYITSPSKQW